MPLSTPENKPQQKDKIPKPKESLRDYMDENGRINPKTVKLLQKYLGFKGRYIDGIAGRKTKKEIQRKLGFKEKKDIDGKFGKKTREKIKTYFSQSQKLRAQIESKLKSKKTEKNKPPQKPLKIQEREKFDKKDKISGILDENGDIPTDSEKVKKLQKLLKKYGYDGSIDGISGKGTQRALKKYLKANKDSNEDEKRTPESYKLSELSPLYKENKKLTKRQREIKSIYKKKKNSPQAKLVRKIFLEAGLSPKIAEQAVLVACAENNLKNTKHVNKDKSIDYGPIQVNSVHLKKGEIAYGYTAKQLENPKISLKIAAAIYIASGSWQPWNGASVVGLKPKRKIARKKIKKRLKRRLNRRLNRRRRRRRRRS